jgi:hypothetical protein
MKMQHVRWLVFGAALALAACSWLPPLPGFGGGPHLTNPAVEACKRKAETAGYEGVGERQSAPQGSEGAYTVTLDVRENAGYGQVTCTYDPKKGAEVPPRKKPES